MALRYLLGHSVEARGISVFQHTPCASILQQSSYDSALTSALSTVHKHTANIVGLSKKMMSIVFSRKFVNQYNSTSSFSPFFTERRIEKCVPFGTSPRSSIFLSFPNEKSEASGKYHVTGLAGASKSSCSSSPAPELDLSRHARIQHVCWHRKSLVPVARTRPSTQP